MSIRPFIFLYFIAIFIFLAHLLIVKSAIYGDGRYYYSYLPSFIIDQNLSQQTAFKNLGIDFFKTPLNYPANIYPIGPAIIWLIPFLFSHLFLSPFGLNDGYNVFYQITIGFWNIGLVIIGLVFLTKTLNKFFSEKIAVLSVVTLFFTTNLFFYGTLDVLNSHSSSFFLSSLFLYSWANNKNPLILGILLGMIALVRPQDALLIIFPLLTLLILKQKYLFKFAVICMVSIAVFSPQFLIWKSTWGSWYINPYLNVASFNFASPQIMGVLFNKDGGLILWTPIIIIALFGLFKFSLKFKQIGISSVIFFLSQLYLISSWSIWWQGASYSGRMFISSLPVFGLGLAYFLSEKRIEKVRLPIIAFFSFLNISLIIFFLLNN